MTTVSDVISSRSLGTGTAQTQLSGDRSGNATDYVLPAWARSVLAVRPWLYELTPTAAQSVLATLAIKSSDLVIGNYEVFAQPLGSALGATAFYETIGQNSLAYPINLPCNGGEHLQFYGQAQIANAVAPKMGATVWISDKPPRDPQYQALVSSVLNNSNNPTSTGTTAANVVGQSISISGSGQRRMKALYGAVVSGTIVASDNTSGYYILQAPEMDAPSILRWNIEPIQGFLGLTGQVINLISKIEGIDIGIRTPSTLATSITLDVAPANAGKFEVGFLYL